MRGKQVSAAEGAYCPVPPAQYLEKMLERGVYVFSEVGELERLCNLCDEYWPADTEFWFTAPRDKGGLFYCCKACYCIVTGRGGARVTQRDERHELAMHFPAPKAA